MVEQQRLCAELRGHAAGVERGGMVLFVRLEPLAVGIQAERLAHEQIAVLGVRAAPRVERLIAQTRQLFAGGQQRREAKLAQLGREYVEKRDGHAEDRARFAVLHAVEVDALVEQREELLRQHQAADRPDERNGVAVAVYIQVARIAVGAHERRDLAQHPDHAERVIRVAVGQKQRADPVNRQVGRLELAEDAVAAARVDEQRARIGPEMKAGVVAARHHRVAGAENGQLCFGVHENNPCRCDVV